MGQMSYGLAPRNCLAITGRRDGGRADIGLNARNIFLVPREGESPLETMFTATLHEMNVSVSLYVEAIRFECVS